MPDYQALKVSNAKLKSCILTLISQDAIADYTPEEVEDLESMRAAYMVLRHSTTYKDDYGPPDDPVSTVKYHERFLRLQRLMCHLHKFPPIAEHLKLIKDMIYLINDPVQSEYFRTGKYFINTFKDLVNEYIDRLTPLAYRVTQTDRKLSNYLSTKQRFYYSPLTDDYDEDDFDSTNYKEYVSELDKLEALFRRGLIHKDVASYILSSRLYEAETRNVDGLDLHLIVNAFPNSVKELWRTRNTWINDNVHVLPDHFTAPIEWQVTALEDNDLTPYYYEDPFLSFPLTIDTVKSRDPFFGFGLGSGFGRPSGSGGSGDHAPSGSGGQHQQPPPQQQPNQQQGQQQQQPPPQGPQPPNQNQPPPQQPTTPDDSTYVPDPALSQKAVPFTLIVQSKPQGELFHDHMTRFGTTNEAPQMVTKASVVYGPDADFKIQTKIRGIKTNYVLTYTRKSRKPIFNVIT